MQVKSNENGCEQLMESMEKALDMHVDNYRSKTWVCDASPSGSITHTQKTLRSNDLQGLVLNFGAKRVVVGATRIVSFARFSTPARAVMIATSEFGTCGCGWL